MTGRTPIARTRFAPGEAFDDSQGLALPEEIAELYGVARSTVMTWARSGSIPHVILPGGSYRLSFAYHQAHLAAELGQHG